MIDWRSYLYIERYVLCRAPSLFFGLTCADRLALRTCSAGHLVIPPAVTASPRKGGGLFIPSGAGLHSGYRGSWRLLYRYPGCSPITLPPKIRDFDCVTRPGFSRFGLATCSKTILQHGLKTVLLHKRNCGFCNILQKNIWRLTTGEKIVFCIQNTKCAPAPGGLEPNHIAP